MLCVQEQIAAVSIHAAVIMQELADLELDSAEEAAWQRAHNLAQQSCEILQVCCTHFLQMLSAAVGPAHHLCLLCTDQPCTDSSVCGL